MDLAVIPTPCYVVDEVLLRNNLSLIRRVKEAAGVDIIMAFKAFALWHAFPLVREYIPYTTASSVNEALLARQEMGSLAHTYSPAYTDADIDTLMACSSHITFNSLSQYERFYPRIAAHQPVISCGLRINPEYSEVETDLYNPCAPGSRLGVVASLIGDRLPQGIEGLHFHTLCESSSYDLEKTLKHVEERFSPLLKQAKWLNMGGGHLMTRVGYDAEHLITLLRTFQAKHPHLSLILEPGSAFAWQTGILVSSVVDIVSNGGITTAILDVSFSCHMPDCLEMPYKPTVRGSVSDGAYTYRLGGNSCLSGDYMGDWSFSTPLKIGDKVVFEDMIHYTLVKTTMFNGISHPSIGMWGQDNHFHLWRKFDYTDYKQRMG